jgi:hypothetical protein
LFFLWNRESFDNQGGENVRMRYSAAEIESPFNDLEAFDDAFMEANFLRSRGILKGYSDGSFKPDRLINRAEFIKLMHEVKNIYPHELLYKNCYKDVKNQWYAPYVCSAKAKGWVNTADNFKPEDNITLAEALKILFIVANMEIEVNEAKEWFSPYMKAADEIGWLKNAGFNANDANKELSRRQVTKLLYDPVRFGFFR